ncbi:MAG: hypothetical protein ACK419_06125, partial [Pyrinomonadaceae bacterium]
MKAILILFLSFLFLACGSPAKYMRANSSEENKADNLIASSHSQNVNKANSNSQSTESPMARPIDVSAMTAEI